MRIGRMSGTIGTAYAARGEFESNWCGRANVLPSDHLCDRESRWTERRSSAPSERITGSRASQGLCAKSNAIRVRKFEWIDGFGVSTSEKWRANRETRGRLLCLEVTDGLDSAATERSGAECETDVRCVYVVTYLVDPASSHMLVSKIKPCMSQYKRSFCETANGSLKQL